MWARHMEIMLGLWMAISPFALRYDPEQAWLWINDFVCSLTLMGIAMAAHWRPLRRLHLLLLPVATWLIAAGWWLTWNVGPHPPAAYQNWILVGLLLAMFAIIPSEASQPPKKWRRAAVSDSG